jgi:hypothetical protein
VEDEGGARFRQLCEKHDLLVPATFSQWHQGPTGTYTGPKGARSRIDYIAVSQSCQEGIERSYVDQEIDILNGERDHRPLLTEIGIKRSQSRVGRMVRQDIYSRRCARSAKMCEPHNFISNLPLQDWSLDVNAHWSNLRHFMQNEAAWWFPDEKRMQKQFYFT